MSDLGYKVRSDPENDVRFLTQGDRQLCLENVRKSSRCAASRPHLCPKSTMGYIGIIRGPCVIHAWNCDRLPCRYQSRISNPDGAELRMTVHIGGLNHGVQQNESTRLDFTC